jgi:alkylation response protein AidB-like acyl-CoA dehydrogenase
MSFNAPIRGHLRCMVPNTFIDTLTDACAAADAWPLPAHGRTLERWQSLSALSAGDLVLGRLVEAHADARAILDELGAPPATARERWGVWAAEAPDAALTATPRTAGQGGVGSRDWTVSGTKPWCSGATLLTHALVTAKVGSDRGLFAVDLAQSAVRPLDPQWTGAGMREADTRTVAFDNAAAVEIGSPGGYLTRPGFWIGAIGVAACWYGGLLPLVEVLSKRVSSSDDPHAAAHLGALYRDVAAARALLREAAAHVDAEPTGDHLVLARTVRSAVENAARTAVDRIARATGPGPLAHDAQHAQRVADLSVYIRQHHAERDLAALGRDVSGFGVEWTL